jgi:hypothetical protein
MSNDPPSQRYGETRGFRLRQGFGGQAGVTHDR